MKKIILLCLLISSVIFYSTSKDLSDVDAVKPAATSASEVAQSKRLKTSPGIQTATIENGSLVEDALDEVKSTESFEASFNALSLKEVKLRLLGTEKILNQSNLFQTANSEQGLDSAAAKQLVELMRIKQALNKILLNRRLEEMHRKYL
jgi:hypothetical protein